MSSSNLKKLLLLFAIGLTSNSGLFGQSTPTNYAKNGIVYVLLSEDFDPSTANCNSGLKGVWRLSDENGNITTAKKLYDEVTSARGLTVNQEKDTSVFLLNSTGGGWATMSAGLTPNISNDDDTCDLWVAAVEPNASHMAKTWRYAFGSSTISGNYAKARSAHVFDNVNYRYWYNEPGSHNGTSYDWICRFGGPAGVANFNGVSGGGGTPMWKGSGNGEIRHKNYSSNRKIIIPCNFGVIGYYLYATSKHPDYNAGTVMDGTEGKKKDGTNVIKPNYNYTEANKTGDAWPAMLVAGNARDKALDPNNNESNYGIRRGNGYSDTYYFGCVIKMIYSERNNSLNLKKGIDKSNSNTPFSIQDLNQNGLNTIDNATGLLETTDYKAVKYFGKWCGDACIPGSGLNAESQNPIINEINVVTTTTDYVYGFNPRGSAAASDKKAMLREVDLAGGSHSPINITNFDHLTNRNYLITRGTINDLKNFGASSKFPKGTGSYLYGSFADRFVVQDSWWGLGGIAYEYDKSTKKVNKLDYMNSTDGQPVITDCGILEGNIDAIGVDGDAYLYALKTECEPKDEDCQTANLSGTTTSGNKIIGGVNTYVSVPNEWWRQPTEGEPFRISSPSQNNDFKKVKISQKVFKRVYRYKEGQSLSLDNDLRGQIEVGTDYYEGRVYYPNYNYIGYGPQGSAKTKVKDLHAELAVVNVADAPVTFNGSSEHYVVVKDSSFKSGDKVAEERKLTFKIEGYKPIQNHVARNFKPMGSYLFNGESGVQSIYINNLHNEITSDNDNSGTMLHDENGDGIYSGFPSSMFESSARPTAVTWYIYQVEDDTEKNIIGPSQNAKIVKKCVDANVVSSTGTGYCYKEYTFNQPGRYIVQARITYNYFDNFGTALRPSDLKPKSSDFIYTKPLLVNVYSSDLVNPPGSTFITNVKTYFDSDGKKSYHRRKYSGIPVGAPDSGADLETAEGIENTNHFGNLRVEFDAEFFGLKEDYSAGSFQTYDGIGVWDYNYYQSIYKKMNSFYGINTLNDNESLKFSNKSQTSNSYHVYNYINESVNTNSEYNPENDNFILTDSSYNEIYNPGFKREFTDSTKDYKAGTEAKGNIYDCDKAFIQWNLYLRKLSGGSTYIPQQKISDTLLNRGEIIASGTIVSRGIKYENDNDNIKDDYVFEPINDQRGINRKYHVGFTIEDIDSRINVPRDPNEYVIDLELIYPRVFWKLDKESNIEVYSSSLVPFNSESGGAAPIHVLSNLITDKKTNNRFNQSDLVGGDNDDKGVGSFTLCVRDSVKPVFFYRDETDKVSSLSLDLKKTLEDEDPKGVTKDIFDYSKLKKDEFDINKGIIYESTGDNLKDGIIDYGVFDNNPFMRFKKPDNIKVTSIIATDTNGKLLVSEELLPEIGDEVSNNIELYYQHLDINSSDLFNSDPSFLDNKKFKKNTNPSRYIKIRQTSMFDEEFYKKDDWKLCVTYSDNIPSMSSLSPTSNNWDFRPIKIKPENWIGTLNYAVYGKVYDGLGTGLNTDVLHYFYADDFEGKAGYPSLGNCDKIDVGSRQYLERLDNDPPSIGIQLLSQSDNRKWDFQLIEAINDGDSFKTEDLGKCRFNASCSKLLENTVLNELSFSSSDIIGVTNVYAVKGEKPDKHDEVMPQGDNKDLSIVNIMDIKGYNIPTFRKASRLIVNVDIFDNCGFKKLDEKECKVTIEGLDYDFVPKIIPNGESHKLNGKIKDEFKVNPRSTFAIDLPTQVKEGNQVTITVKAVDHMGNRRSLVIPIKIQESSYEARVIEHSEQKN